MNCNLVNDAFTMNLMFNYFHFCSRKFSNPFSLFLLFSVFINYSIFSQNDRIKAQAAFAEKVYLQLDGSVYTTNQTIWFKAIVASAANHLPSPLTGVLHVDLIGPDEQVLEKKLIKIKNGIGDNYFDLHEDYPKGRYLIRAYTQWNKNFDAYFIFKTYINVFPSSQEEKRDAISALKLIERKPGEFWLKTHIRPKLIDSLQKKSECLPLF